MMPAISLAFLVFLQANPVSEGIAEFHRGDFKAARQHLQQAPNDIHARAFLALTDAATGQCETALPELERQFSAKSDLYRIEGSHWPNAGSPRSSFRRPDP